MARVLIVDDAAFMRMSLKAILERNGFEIVGEADSGETGIVKYRETKPDIVTLDIIMSDMDGFETLKKILEYDSKAKIVMVSSMGQVKSVKKSILNGAQSFIVKPFKEEKLVQTLNEILNN